MHTAIDIQVKLRTEHINLPVYASNLASGMDMYADLPFGKLLNPNEITIIPTGIYVSIPEGYEIQIRPRSGLAIKHGITVVNSPGTIDADYRGEIKVGIINLSQSPYWIAPSERIAQMVLCPVYRANLIVVPELDETVRGENGFGHTGKGELNGNLQ